MVWRETKRGRKGVIRDESSKEREKEGIIRDENLKEREREVIRK
jgi:hypothetical protein